MKNSYDIIIIGGGIVGVSAAYYASLENLRVLLIEKDSIASHASGFAYGGITPHVGLEENILIICINLYQKKFLNYQVLIMGTDHTLILNWQ